MKLSKRVSAGLALVLSISAVATAEESPYVTELKNFFETIRNHYAPLELKRDTIGYDYDASKSRAFAAVDAMKSSSDFYGVIAEFLNNLNDAHVSVTLPSSLAYTLPIQMSAVEGKVVVNYIDRNKLSVEKCAVKVGDELVKLNGATPAQIQASDPAFRKYGNDRTNAAFFARMLSNVKEASGLRMKQLRFDSANAQFARADGSRLGCVIPYEKSGVPVIGRSLQPARPLGIAGESLTAPTLDGDELPEFLRDPRFLRLNGMLERYQRLINTDSGLGGGGDKIPSKIPFKKGPKPNFEGKHLDIGAQTPFFALPKDFRRIRPSLVGRPVIGLANDFYAGTFMRGGKRVGFLRVPSYMPPLAYLMSFGIRFYIAELEANSDLLIIDQTNNPGGAVVMSDLLVKGLVGKYDSSKHMRFRMKPTQSFLRSYADMLEMIDEDARDPDGAGTMLSAEERAYFTGEMKKNYELIASAFEKGEALSEPVSLMIMSEFFETVIDKLADKLPVKFVIEKMIGGKVFTAQTYTKPVYMMINELDFSGGDATPAILQDYGRVKLVGVRTSGAGGTVEEFTSRVTSDLKFRLTTSLMYRKGGKYVENYGITPDLAFELNRADYRDGFKDTFERFMKTIGI